MPRADSTISTLIIAATLAAVVGLLVVRYGALDRPQIAGVVAQGAPRQVWAASAPGRIEPRTGEVRLTTPAASRIVAVPVHINDRVLAGDLLVRLEDEDARARVAAAEAEAAVRRRERDQETVSGPAAERRRAEDAVAAAERALAHARADFDRELQTYRNNPASGQAVTKARDAVRTAEGRLDQERANVQRVQATAGMPLPTRLEAALAAARAELSLAEAALERTRIRAPGDGTVLQLNAKVGEVAAPSLENPLAVLGDVTALRVRAEVEERDVAKVRAGQKVVVRGEAFPDRDFDGEVTMVAQSLSAPKMTARGPRKPTDFDVLEVVAELSGSLPLLPGMRVDVFFRPEQPATTGSASGEVSRPTQPAPSSISPSGAGAPAAGAPAPAPVTKQGQ
jgi:HlyD family secretion protein